MLFERYSVLCIVFLRQNTSLALTMKVPKKRQLYGAAAIAAEKKRLRLLAESEK